MEPWMLSATDASDLIRTRELSPVELTESVLGRIDAVEDRVGAFATVTADAARVRARAAEAEIAAGNYRGPLHGLTYGMKDLVNTAGVRTTSSSRTRANYVPEEDGAVVELLDAAGAVMVGKTHTHEYAFGVITPTTRNPWNLEHIPGGSSGGSGAALAAGMCHLAIGTDTGGSIRIPSAVCGVTGLKPTYGRVSRRGVASLSWALDHIGPMARTVADVALMLQHVAGYDRSDPASRDVPVPDYSAALDGGVQGLRIGVPTNYFFDHIDPAVADAVRALAARLGEAGADVVDAQIPMPEAYMPVEYCIFLAEASAYHQQRIREQADEFEPDVRLLLEAGEMVPATDYIRALRVRTLLQQGWRDLFNSGLDAVLAPTLPNVAARVGQDTFDRWGVTEAVIDSYVRTSAPGNLTGLPAMSVPCGFSEGLPIGAQIIGRPYDEATVLRIGSVAESTYAEAGRMPQL